MGKTKIIEVSITALKVTSEDVWMDDYIKDNGSTIKDSVHYAYLKGFYLNMKLWMSFRQLPYFYITVPLMKTLKSLIKHGQKEPIKIYADMRINTGHKRAACMLFLGHDKIKAVVVPDNYKL